MYKQDGITINYLQDNNSLENENKFQLLENIHSLNNLIATKY